MDDIDLCFHILPTSTKKGCNDWSQGVFPYVARSYITCKGQSWHVIWCLWKPWPHGAAVSDLPRQKSNFPQNKEVQFSIYFCSILCIKYFLICKIKRYVIMFFVYKNRFPARQIGPVMAFIPDNISVHVHLLEDYDRIKKTKIAAVSCFFQPGWFSTKTTRVFQRRSLLVYLFRFCRQRKVKTFSSCGAHFRSGDNIFFCSNCNDNSVHHSKDAFV